MQGTTVIRKRNNLPALAGHEEDSPLYAEGDVLECSPESARHFTNKGVAVLLPEKETGPSKLTKAPVTATTAEEDAGYDEKTVAELHELATQRAIEGRGSMDKAALVKALEADDKAKATSAPPKSPTPTGKK